MPNCQIAGLGLAVEERKSNCLVYTEEKLGGGNVVEGTLGMNVRGATPSFTYNSDVNDPRCEIGVECR